MDGYIDTGINPVNHFLEIRFDFMTYLNDEHLFGTTEPGSAAFSGNFYHFTSYGNRYYWGNQYSESNGGTFSEGVHELLYNYGENYQVILDNKVLGEGKKISVNETGEYNLCIGRRNNLANFSGRIYSIKVTDKSTDTLVADCVPCYCTKEVINANNNTVSSGTVGLYNIVKKQFYTNQGSGEITKPSD